MDTAWRLGGEGCGNGRCFLPVQPMVSVTRPRRGGSFDEDEDEDDLGDVEEEGDIVGEEGEENIVDEVEFLDEDTGYEDSLELVQGGDPYEKRRIDGCARSVRCYHFPAWSLSFL